jgi:hypothetical protein
MLYQEKPLDQIIEEMRAFGERLVPYNFPKTPPSYHEDLSILKQRSCTIDGYEIVLHYSKSDFDTHKQETLQIYGENMPFLPFCLICKLGKKFLGGHELQLVELFKDNRKIYCWSVSLDDRGRPIPSPYEVKYEECVYEGFNYSYMTPDQVDFY